MRPLQWDALPLKGVNNSNQINELFILISVVKNHNFHRDFDS